MEIAIQILSLATAAVGLAGAVLALLPEAQGKPRRGKKNGRRR